MIGKANYVVPRIIKTVEVESAGFGCAIIEDLYPSQAVCSIIQDIDFTIIADASIYNKQELLEKLGESNLHDGYSDAAIILKSFIKWNKSCVDFLYGDFAFVIFDHIRGEIFSARDQMGVRPLFYVNYQEWFLFSSELRIIKGTLELVGRPEYFYESLVTKKTEKKWTPFKDIFRLPPAHLLSLSSSNFELLHYWDLDFETELKLASEQEYCDYYRNKLIKAVDMRVIGNLKIATELSGGLDSSSVNGIAADSSRNEGYSLKAFSNVFPEQTEIKFNDEREFIHEMVHFKKIDWEGVETLSRSIPDLLNYALNIQGSPIQQNFSIFNNGLYNAVAQSKIHVLLSGFGGDELVSASIPFPWNEMIRKRQWKRMYDELYGNGVTIRSIFKPISITLRYIKSSLDSSTFRTGSFTSELLDRRFSNLPLQPNFSLIHSLKNQFIEIYKRQKRKTVTRLQFDRIMMDHICQRMEYCYAAAAQYGIEYRYPLLDIELLQAALSIPAWLKHRHGTNRYIFRQAIVGFIPEKIRLRNDKSGNPIPQKFYQLIRDKEEIIDLITKASGSNIMKKVFDFTKFLKWFDLIIKRDTIDRNYLLPGAFYTYLMIILYYMDHENELKQLLNQKS